MNNTLNSVITQAARKLGVDPAYAKMVYKSYWKFIRESISELDLDNVSPDDFPTLITNFNIPYIGKLHTNYEKIEKYKRKLKFLENVKAKGNQTNV